MSSQTCRRLACLIRLDKGKAKEIHFTGLDDRCWTLQQVREGRKFRWHLFAGASWPGSEKIEFEFPNALSLERVDVVSLIPLRGSRQFVSFAIRADGSTESYNVRDPDPGD